MFLELMFEYTSFRQRLTFLTNCDRYTSLSFVSFSVLVVVVVDNNVVDFFVVVASTDFDVTIDDDVDDAVETAKRLCPEWTSSSRCSNSSRCRRQTPRNPQMAPKRVAAMTPVADRRPP